MGEVTAAIMLAEMGEDRARFPTAGRAARRDRDRAGDPLQRTQPNRPVPLRRKQADAPRHRLVGVRRRPRERLGPRGLPAGPRSRGQLHNRALRGVGARWTRILWRCWTDHTTYDPARHLEEPASRDHRLTTRHHIGSPATPSSRAPTSHARQTPRGPSRLMILRLTAGVCIIHLIRNTFRLTSRKYWDAIKRDLKPIYTAVNAAAARAAFEELAEKWGASATRPSSGSGTTPGREFIPFLDYGGCCELGCRGEARDWGFGRMGPWSQSRGRRRRTQRSPSCRRRAGATGGLSRRVEGRLLLATVALCGDGDVRAVVLLHERGLVGMEGQPPTACGVSTMAYWRSAAVPAAVSSSSPVTRSAAVDALPAQHLPRPCEGRPATAAATPTPASWPPRRWT